jgi:hypothetical protein
VAPPRLTELACAAHERADAAANRQRVLNAARRLFEQRGVEQGACGRLRGWRTDGG